MRRYEFWLGIVILCQGTLAGLNAQSFVDLDLALPTGSCEVDVNRDGLSDGLSVSSSWSDWRAALNATPTLDANRKFAGFFSQAFHFSRANGDAGSITLTFPLLRSTYPIAIRAGQPLLIRARYYAEAFQNAEYRFVCRTGNSFPILQNYRSAESGGWQTLSIILPAQADQNGNLVMNFYVEIRVGAGAAAGRIWIDEVECILPQFVLFPSSLPNPTQLAVFNDAPSHWLEYLSLSSIFPSVAVQKLEMGYPLKRIFGDRIECYLYVGTMNTPVDPQPPYCLSLYACGDILQTHPDWVLRDANGNPLIYSLYNTYYVDVGLPAVQQRAVEKLTELATNFPIIDGFFFDNFADWPGQNCARYPTYESIFPAWTAWVNTVTPVVRQTLRKKIIANIGARPGLFLNGVRPMAQWIQSLDGILIESPLAAVDYNARTYTLRSYTSSPTSYYSSSWRNFVRVVQEYPNIKLYTIMYWDQRDTQASMLRYSLATYWLVYRPGLYLYCEDRLDPSYHFIQFAARPELYIPLGNPTGNIEVVQGSWDTGGLFRRSFQYGLVLVNPTNSTTYEYITPRTYKNWDGQVVPANTRLTLPPKTGVVLYAAPEVKVTLSPTEITAIPEGTVTFTVTCRNEGLAAATNVQVKIPIPAGLTVTSVGSNGVVTNGTIQWTISSLSPGATHQMQFQVRVQ